MEVERGCQGLSMNWSSLHPLPPRLPVAIPISWPLISWCFSGVHLFWFVAGAAGVNRVPLGVHLALGFVFVFVAEIALITAILRFAFRLIRFRC
ncbi:hypothetical protein XELAEV_18031146mg [Xenopus laevis]|uniref:Uncharacterized protein n=1 Tax=Xenopus laevis TaxID=8355 RepID=A0A974CNR2_XENLA|nr:hypothetical protein XELAEV_18031146mg [Xenopus laevis]